MAQFLDHLHIILHALFDALCLDGVAHLLEECHLLHQVVLYLTDSDVRLLLRGHKEIGGVEAILLKFRKTVEGDGINLLDGIDLVIPEGDSQHHLTISHRDIYRITLHTEVATLKIQIVPDVKRLY